MLSSYIGDKYVYGIQYTYTSNGHIVVDNRYAFLVGNSMYLVTTKEENTNTAEINVYTLILSIAILRLTMKETSYLKILLKKQIRKLLGEKVQ